MGSLIAIDPGSVSGALAVFPHGNGRDTYATDIAVVDKQVDAASLHHILIQIKPDACVIEKAQPFPKQGVTGVFNYGVAFGLIRGVLASHGVPVHYVSSPVWKKSLGLIGKDAEASREMAIRLYPGASKDLNLKRHHNRAEALLIGHWFLHYRGNPKKK